MIKIKYFLFSKSYFHEFTCKPDFFIVVTKERNESFRSLLRHSYTKTKKISHQQILDCVIILLARPRTKNYSARISCNLVQLIRLFITVFILTPPKVYTDPLQPIRPNNYITESPPTGTFIAMQNVIAWTCRA